MLDIREFNPARGCVAFVPPLPEQSEIQLGVDPLLLDEDPELWWEKTISPKLALEEGD